MANVIKSFHANHEQKEAITSLAYWLADNSWVREHYNNDKTELKQSEDTIEFCFNQCDRVKVPFWVQNIVIGYASDWRKYESSYTSTELKKQGVVI